MYSNTIHLRGNVGVPTLGEQCLMARISRHAMGALGGARGAILAEE